MTDDEMLKSAVRSNTGMWFMTHGKIWAKDRTKGIITPTTNHLQKQIQAVVEIFEVLNLPVRIAGLKPRARGSTTYFTGLGYTIMRRSSISAAFIGGQSDQTVGLWNMIKTYKANDRFEWGNTGEVNEKGAEFSNGSRAKKETARDVQAGIGDTYQLLHCTEAARWTQYGVANAGEVMANILKAVPRLPRTYIFLESTAEGANGDFYERYVRAVDAEDFISGKVVIQSGDYVRVFAAWFEFEESAMELTPEQKLEIERTLDDDPEFRGERELIEAYGHVGDDGVTRLGTVVKEFDVWEQLAWRRYAIEKECKRSVEIFNRDYPHSWRTAFQKSGAQRFNSIGLERMRRRLGQVQPKHGIIEQAKKQFAFRQTSEGESTVTIFEKPIPGCRYIMGVDPMTGITQVGGLDPDWHSALILRVGYWNAKRQWVRRATAARVIQCRWEIDLLESTGIWPLSRYYGSPAGSCMIAIEMNQDRGLTELLKLRGANLYVREFFNQRENRPSKALGYQTNEKTREKLIEKLATAIRQSDADDGIDIWCPLALEQCENFVRKQNGRSEAAEGWKDDDVFALGLCVELEEHATPYIPVASMMNGFGPFNQTPQQAAQTAWS